MWKVTNFDTGEITTLYKQMLERQTLDITNVRYNKHKTQQRDLLCQRFVVSSHIISCMCSGLALQFLQLD